MKKQNKIHYIAKPTPSQVHMNEFNRSVIDLGTTELEYRLIQNGVTFTQTQRTISELAEKLKQCKKESTKLTQEHDVLTEIITSRR